MTMTSESSSRHAQPHPDSTLEIRAELLQELLAEDGIEIPLEDARDLVLAEAVERLMEKALDVGLLPL